MDIPQDDRLMSAEEVAEWFGMSGRWVREHGDELGGFKVGKKWKYRKQDLDKYVQRLRTES